MKKSLMLIALLLISAIKLSDAIIKVNFTLDEFNQYTASIAGQEYAADETYTKVLGKNLPGQKSSDVKVIDCSDKGNKFDRYPPMISSIFYDAEVLLLQNSGLKKLAYDSFVHTKKIKIIMFAKDNFDIEAAVFRDCVELEVLKFEDMDLSNVNVEAFEGISNLNTLVMKNCQLTRLEQELLEPLQNLKELHITENPMIIPPISAIQRMSHLKVLNLSGNKLTHLHDDLFKNKNYLEFVDVSGNEIIEIQRDILLHWPAHTTVDMEGNLCINRKFDHVGTESLTVSDVANALMPCFKDKEGFSEEENSSSMSIEDSIEKFGEIKEKSSEEKIVVKSKEEENQPKSKESDSSESIEDRKSFEVEEKEIKSSKEEKSTESKSSESVEEKVKSIEVIKENKSNETLDVKEDKILTESKSNEFLMSIEKSFKSEENLKSSEKSPKTKKSNEELTEEIKNDDEVVATISPYEFMEQEELPAIVTELPNEKVDELEEIDEAIEGDQKVPEDGTTGKKKRTKKIKKTTEAPPSTNPFIEMPEPATSFLHPYEIAKCRFFVDHQEKYNCVLENVTSEVKKISVDHLPGYDNSKVDGLFLRNSVLVRLPEIFFDTFVNLEHLSVEKSNLKQLDEDTVKGGCGKLKTLSMKDNYIRRLERYGLRECQHLENLDLTGNPMEYIEGDIFNYNPKLSIILGALKIVAPALTSF